QCHPWLPPLSEFPLPGPLPSKSSPLLFTTSPANDKVQLAPLRRCLLSTRLTALAFEAIITAEAEQMDLL
ncbi:MAG: hypothetical protein ABSG68_24815, partial [Thermoguttaceae bacterium]